MVHDPENKSVPGDIVLIEPWTHPLRKTRKHFQIAQILFPADRYVDHEGRLHTSRPKYPSDEEIINDVQLIQSKASRDEMLQKLRNS